METLISYIENKGTCLPQYFVIFNLSSYILICYVDNALLKSNISIYWITLVDHIKPKLCKHDTLLLSTNKMVINNYSSLSFYKHALIVSTYLNKYIAWMW
jgi:hypothetical protein